jgi:hypothetical protein
MGLERGIKKRPGGQISSLLRSNDRDVCDPRQPRHFSFVMAGLDPAIHVFISA